MFEDTRTRLAKSAIADYKKFTEKKEDLEKSGISVLLSWAFDTRRYKFGDSGTTYLDDNGNHQIKERGCLAHVSVFVVISILVLVLTAFVI